MSAFYDNNVTDVGKMLLGDIQMGASFVPTKIVIGKGYMPQGKTTRTMTAVADVVKELSLNKAMKNPDGDAIFGAIFTNEDIQQAFYYRELALYAKGVYFNEAGGVERETEEVLYSYGNAGDNAELIPAYGTGTVVERQLDLLVYIGNDAKVNLTVETGIYVTIPVFNDAVEKIEKEIAGLTKIYVQDEKPVDSGAFLWLQTNTSPVTPTSDDIIFECNEPSPDDEVQIVIDGKTYGITNATSEEQKISQKDYLIDVEEKA